MTVFPLVDGAALIRFASNAPAVAHAAHLRTVPDVLDAIPAAQTVLVLYARGFDVSLLGASVPELEAPAPARVVIPMRYAPELEPALRLEHRSATYRVAFIGFAPGFPYLVGLPPSLHRPRLSTPRVRTPAGSVAVAGEYCGIYPAELPGGWNVIGHTGLRLFDPRAERPSLLAPGDEVRFEEGDAPAPPPPSPEASTFPLRFVSSPRGASVQGGPRFGWGHYGVPPGGAMDLAALEEGNARVGNPPHARALEIALLGPELEVLRDGFVCTTGSPIEAPFPHRRAVPVRAGDRLRLGRVMQGARSYVCFGEQAVQDVAPHDVTPSVLRLCVGPQADHFSEAARRTLLDAPWKVSSASDRRGVRLDGPTLAHVGPTEIPPEGNAPGAVQVPASGQPIILGPDRPVTGGYPKIATVVPDDLARLAQLRPGAEVRFALRGAGLSA
jgi:allophanate hydrolase subunit 2/allophanate hydrolase subunit 1